MDKSLEKYLDSVDRKLKDLPDSLRKEILSSLHESILQLQAQGLDPKQIRKTMKSPAQIRAQYIGPSLKHGNCRVRQKILSGAFYVLSGLVSIFVVPFLAVSGPGFLVMGLLCPILGLAKMLDLLFQLDFAWLNWIQIEFFDLVLSARGQFLLSVLTGVILIILGILSLRLLRIYLKKVGQLKASLIA